MRQVLQGGGAMKLTFSEAKFDGGWLCLKVNEPAHARAFILKLGRKLYDCSIKEHREKRSLDANAYAWVLIDKISKETNVHKTDVYREAIREVGGNTDIICVPEKSVDALCEGWGRGRLGWLTDRMPSKLPGCVNVVLYYGSSTFDTQQMSRLIDGLVQDCRALGLETLPPDKLALLKEAWDT